MSKNKIRSAIAAHQRGELKKAYSLYSEIIKQGTGLHLSTVHANAASILLATGNLAGAISHYEEAIRIDPDNERFLLSLAILYERAGELVSSFAILERVLLLSPNNIDNLLSYAVLKEKLGDHKSCDTILQQIIESNPDCHRAEFFLGNLQFREGSFHHALSHMSKAIAIEPNIAEYHCNASAIYIELNQLEEAEREARAAIFLNKCSLDSYANLSLALRRQGNIEDALSESLYGLSIDNSHLGCNICAASCYAVKGELEKALHCLETVLIADPAHADASLALSWISPKSLRITDIMAKLDSHMASSSVSPLSEMKLCFAGSRYYHHMRAFTESAALLKRGNKIRLDIYSTDKNDILKAITHANNRLDAKTRDINQRMEKIEMQIILIVGLPRCGSTLVEAILSGNPQSYALGEGLTVAKWLKKHELSGGSANHPCLLDMYMEEIPMGERKIKYIIDKNVYNFLYLDKILDALPNTKIIHCDRNPLDAMLSMFRACFDQGNKYCSSIEDMTSIFIEKNRLMKRFEEEYPTSIMTLSYNSVCKNSKETIKELTGWLGWEWSEYFLDHSSYTGFHDTASSLDVRNKIYTSSIDSHLDYSVMFESAAKQLTRYGNLFVDFVVSNSALETRENI